MPVVRNPQFYFKNGFCWTDVNTTYIKARLKENGVYDVLSMSLFSLKENIPNWYIVCLLNSRFISEYIDTFINSTQHFQINDARIVPIMIPTEEQLKSFKEIFDKSYSLKKKQFNDKTFDLCDIEKELNELQKRLDTEVYKLYDLNVYDVGD